MRPNPTKPTPLDARFDPAAVGLPILVSLSMLATIGAIAASGLTFSHAGSFFSLFGGMMVALAGLNVYQCIRMPENRRMIILLNMVIIYMIMAVNMMIFQYCMALFKAYPISEYIEEADRAVGFHWLQFSQTVHAVPYLSETIGFCYKNWMREFILVFLVMSYRGQFGQLYELTTNYIIAGMSTLLVSGFLDAKSRESVAAYALKGIHYPSGVSPEYLVKLEHLRAGVDTTLDFDQVIGLVAFPSFHAGAAVLLATATREIKWFWLPFLVFNVMVLVGTITEGGHNATDVVFGCAFAIGAIAIGKAYRGSRWLSRISAAIARWAASWTKSGAAAATGSA